MIRVFGGDLANTDKMSKVNAILMALAFIMLFGAGVAALTLSLRASSNIDHAVEALKIRSELKEIMSLVQDAEIGQRGFLLTRDPQYLEPYNAARLFIDRRLTALQALVERDSEQAARLERLKEATRQRLQETDTTIALGREGRFGEALTIISRDQGKALMDEIRTIILEARAAESARHDERAEKMISSRAWLSTSLIGALCASLVLAILSFQLTRHQFATVTSKRDQLIALNEELEARVRERTQELEIARERAEAETNRAEYERGRVELLLREVTHRVGNNLAMVSSLLRMQQAKLDDDAARSAIETARGRIQTISTAQRRLRLGDDLQSTAVDGLLEAVVSDLADSALDGTAISISGHFDPLVVSARDATTLAVVLGELISNAIKHAFDGRESGTIRASFTIGSNHIPCMVVEDDGIGLDPSDDSKRRSGLGSMIIESLSRQYGGEIEKRTNEHGGTSIIIRLPKLQIVDANTVEQRDEQ